MKKIIFILILFLSCYIIYNLTVDSKLSYLSIGDSLSKGVNIYGIKQYGYSDYVKDYLDKNDKLKKYNNVFSDGNYRITDVIKMIEYNEKKNFNGKSISINQSLKNADVVTLSVGMYELYSKLENKDENIYNYINELLSDMNNLLFHINKFNYKKVFVLGYYNVGVNQEYINYVNVKLKNIVLNYGFEYIDLSNIFDNNPRYFDKKNSFIPNNEGYLKISQIIIEKLEKY